MSQLITIDEKGGMTTLLSKKGQGLDLRQFGQVEIRRSSLIHFCQETQEWFIEFLQGEFVNSCATKRLLRHWNISTPKGMSNDPEETEGVLYFPEYEDAVKAEILIIQTIRKHGNPHII